MTPKERREVGSSLAEPALYTLASTPHYYYVKPWLAPLIIKINFRSPGPLRPQQLPHGRTKQ
jgi:hypothetical protein